ncbi:hypothetical protein NQ117_15325 [Paenibacillus sp. SC116]|uniref:YrpD family protein n=1 Tax=Paenibacillus sp. SC116 TaxID=2968986 RepID=UPI00215A5BCE|nr:YrpD family protein [Paenibacillus sp. SC116]MCR8845053.1 hypothetical protein [Paenibacillus sp. SC116]
MKSVKKVFAVICLLSLTLPNFSAVAKTEGAIQLTGTNGQAVNIIQQASVTVDQSQAALFIQQAKEAIEQDKLQVKGLNANTDATNYNYIAFSDKVTYFYEESPGLAPELVIYDSSKGTNPVEEIESSLEEPRQQVVSNFIHDGVGGRQKIQGRGDFLSTALQLPQDYEVVRVGGAFNYGGFQYTSNRADGIGTWVADMGLLFDVNSGASGNKKGWQPFVALKKKVRPTTSNDSGFDSYASSFDPHYNEGQYKNAYQSGSQLTFHNWYNYNGKVRLKVEGTTICNNRSCTSETPTHTVTIMESNGNWYIPSISYWKVVSTVITTSNSGKNKGIFSNIQLNDYAISTSDLFTPEEDQTKITRSGTSVTIDVDASRYRN